MKISYIRVFQMDLPGQKARHISGGHGDGYGRATSLQVLAGHAGSSTVCPCSRYSATPPNLPVPSRACQTVTSRHWINLKFGTGAPTDR